MDFFVTNKDKTENNCLLPQLHNIKPLCSLCGDVCDDEAPLPGGVLPPVVDGEEGPVLEGGGGAVPRPGQQQLAGGAAGRGQADPQVSPRQEVEAEPGLDVLQVADPAGGVVASVRHEGDPRHRAGGPRQCSPYLLTSPQLRGQSSSTARLPPPAWCCTVAAAPPAAKSWLPSPAGPPPAARTRTCAKPACRDSKLSLRLAAYQFLKTRLLNTQKTSCLARTKAVSTY